MIILDTLKKKQTRIFRMKKQLSLIFISLFFIFAFSGILFLYSTAKKSENILQDTARLVEKSLSEISDNSIENPVIITKLKSIPTHITYFRTTEQSYFDHHNFAEAHLKNISPFLCHFIIKNKKPFQMRLFVNNQETFFGANSSICFQKLKNDVHFYFELYSYSPYYHMKEPELCLTAKDCSSEEADCINGYCKKSGNDL